MIFSYVLLCLAILLTGISQVLMKTGSSKKEGGRFQILTMYLNIPTVTAYGLLLVTTILSVIVLQDIPLKVFYAVASLNFLIVTALSYWWLNERIDREMKIALVLIFAGVLVFNLPF
jgi:multidrug transporter EmrE-like cation transporter